MNDEIEPTLSIISQKYFPVCLFRYIKRITTYLIDSPYILARKKTLKIKMINFSNKSSTLHESHESLKIMEQDLLQRSNKAEVTIEELKY